MKIRLKYFAGYREITGKREDVIDLREGVTAANLLSQVVSDYPALGPLAQVSRFVVNLEYVAGETLLSDGDEVVFLPPVSGGDNFVVTDGPLDLGAAAAATGDENVGAVVMFIGRARRFSRGKRVEHLEYEAFEPMAEKKLAEIGAAIRRQWPVADVSIQHRVGRIAIGETSIVIAVGAAHRDAAFAACRYAIEQIKQNVPVWKKEVWDDGEVWVGMEGA